jgi:formylglycine-generating enzyme required for sulfatase activity
MPQRSATLAKGVEMTFNFIPPGTFLMGSPSGQGHDDERPQHRVTLMNGFFLGVYQVTQAQWQAVMGINPSHFKGANQPVATVSWEDCQAFCRKLGERDGKRYRLPTEAEWEYACRVGTTTEYCSGTGLEALRQVGWCSYDGFGSAKETKPVGQLRPNAWGLYDMHGNVLEWCLDGGRTYSSGAIEDPVGPQNKDDARVLRGGSWYYYPSSCRSANRVRDAPSYRNLDGGCRVVLCQE